MITRQRIPWASFDALCAGAADQEGLSALRNAQVTKHLLLLRLVLDHLRGDVKAARAAVLLLDEIRERHRAAFDGLFGYPYIAAGLARSLRVLRAGGDPATVAGFLSAAAVTAAAHAGREAVLDEVPVTGPVHLPTVGRFDRPGTGVPIRLATAEGRITVDGMVVDLRDPSSEHDGWTGIRQLAGDGSGAPLFDDVDPHRETDGLAVRHRLPEPEFATWSGRFTEAAALLAERHPARAAQITAVVRAVTPLAVLKPGQGRSASAWQAYGAVSMTLPADASSFVVTLIHESQHSILNALLDVVDLYDPADRGLYYSPWRADPRPLRGLLHGCYAFLAVAEFWSHECGVPGAEPRAAFEAARARAQVGQALNALEDAASLTADGRRIVTGIRQRLDTIGTHPGMRAVGHLADLACADHRLSWRLRVLVPDPATVTAAAEAWRAGAVAPRSTAPARFSAVAETFVPNARIQRLGRIARQDPDAEAATGADRLLADRSYPEAATAYAAAVRRNGDDLDAWTGLAIAGGRRGDPAARLWSHRPELIRAVYRELAATGTAAPPDPLALAGWLARGPGD